MTVREWLERRRSPIVMQPNGRARVRAGRTLEPGGTYRMPDGSTAVFYPLPRPLPPPVRPRVHVRRRLRRLVEVEREVRAAKLRPQRPKYGYVNWTPARVRQVKKNRQREWERAQDPDGPALFYRRERFKSRRGL